MPITAINNKMEEKKLSVEIQKRDLSKHVQKMEDGSNLELGLRNAMNNQNDSSMMFATGGDGVNENWYELRFAKVGPDRRGYHSTFVHNKK